jgi:hypothetical protein
MTVLCSEQVHDTAGENGVVLQESCLSALAIGHPRRIEISDLVFDIIMTQLRPGAYPPHILNRGTCPPIPTPPLSDCSATARSILHDPSSWPECTTVVRKLVLVEPSPLA